MECATLTEKQVAISQGDSDIPAGLLHLGKRGHL